jgi:RNA-binding protein YhbY
MGGTSEREFMQKIEKMRGKMGKNSTKIKKEFTKLEMIKVNLLKKTEEDRHNGEREIDKMQHKIKSSKDLAPESKRRLNTETSSLKVEIRETHFDLKTRIAETVIPA